MSSRAHHGDSAVAMQFDNLVQQREAAGLGMWAFLATEVLFFGGVLAAYTVYRLQYHESFVEGSHKLLMWLGAINTVVLLFSSFTMAMAVHTSAHDPNPKMLVMYLVLTIVLGSMFLGIKGIEYTIDWHEKVVPAFNFDPGEFKHPGQVQLFFLFYYFLTMLHALHMTIGIGLMLLFVYWGSKGKFLAPRHTPVEMLGLYWHFVDIVWIFLFPLLYLIG